MIINADWLGADLSQIQAVVLSHGHFDHAGGLAGRQRTRSLRMVVHPMIWACRRLAVPGREPDELPTLSKQAACGHFPWFARDGHVRVTGALIISLIEAGRRAIDHR